MTMNSCPENISPSISGQVLPSSFDIKRVLTSVNKYLNPSRSEFLLQHHVSKVKDGYVYVSFALPEGMINCFISFLQSMAGFFRIVDVKARSLAAQERSISLEENEQRKLRRQQMDQLVCDQYDKYIKLGRTRNESISLTNSTLKNNGHVWVTYEGVKDILRVSGRFRKVKLMEAGKL